MPKKTLRRPYNVPAPRKCCHCGKEVRQRDLSAGKAKRTDDDAYVCPFCLVTIERPAAPPAAVEPETPAEEPAPNALRELKDVRQIKGEPHRRWFTNGDVDLIVWLDDNRIGGFQLLVPHDGEQVALTWRKEAGLSIAVLDDGEDRPGRPKMTPILAQRGEIDIGTAISIFREVSGNLPLGLTEFVEHTLTERKSPEKETLI